jgi:hypothetical protein
LSDDVRQPLDALLETDETPYSPLHLLKQPPGSPSPAAFNKLVAKLEQIVIIILRVEANTRFAVTTPK